MIEIVNRKNAELITIEKIVSIVDEKYVIENRDRAPTSRTQSI